MLRSTMLAKISLVGIFGLLAAEAQATLPNGDDQAVSATQAELSTTALPPKAAPSPRSPVLRAERSKKPTVDGSRRALLPKHSRPPSPVTGDKSNSTAFASGDAVAKGRTVTVVTDEEAGVEYFCRHSRRRLWIQDQGWVIRRVPSCF